MSLRIIGIGGTNGSGKDTISEMLANDHGWLFISASRDLIIPELKKRGLPLEREHMSALTAEWRKGAPKGSTVNRAIEKYEQKTKSKQYKGLVISSIRHPLEADRIHELGGMVIWVDADPQVRYRRANSRGQGDKDQKTFEEFLEEQKREMSHSGHKATNNMAAVRDQADIFIENNGSDIEVFKAEAIKILQTAKIL